MFIKRIVSLSLISLFVFGISIAQSGDGYGEDGPFTAEETNIYLQSNTPTAPAPVKTPAQVANGALSGNYSTQALSCPYAFERDLYTGSVGEDVKLLQVILNSDNRTLISYEGPGSRGQETTSFGGATKEAVKRFQALFIEYVGIANGRFGPRTRTVMNAICNGDYSISGSSAYKNVQTTATNANSNDKVLPRISLAANLNAVNRGDYFKIIFNSSEEIQALTPENIIVDGGTVREIRKLAKTSYAVYITTNEDARQTIVQVEADSVSDLAGNKNEYASNEIFVKILVPTTATASTTTSDINSLLDKIVSSVPTCSYNAQGLLITGTNLNTQGCAERSSSGQTYDCYGQQIPIAQQCPYDPYRAQQQQQQQMLQQQMQAQQQQTLGQLLGSLLKGGGSNSSNPGGSQQQQTQTGPGNTQSPPASPPPAGDPNAKQDTKTNPTAPTTNTPTNTPQNADNNDTVVSELTKCSADYVAFCFSGSGSDATRRSTTVDTRTFLMKKGSEQYLMFSEKSKLGTISTNSCILQQPAIATDKYKVLELVGCAKNNFDCKIFIPKDPSPPARKGMKLVEWIGSTNDPKLQASFCSPSASSNNKTSPTFAAPGDLNSINYTGTQ
jgi:hypothetical protein